MYLVSVVPQPVYMNMSDLDRMREQKLEAQQSLDSEDPDGLDLKTPTQEDLDTLDALPPSSDSSSSGYGSQGRVCGQPGQQGYTDGRWRQTIICFIVPCYFSSLANYYFLLSAATNNRRAHSQICSLPDTN